jgi:ferredoxin
MPQVKFINENKTIEVPAGANLREEALKAGIDVYRWRHKLVNCYGHGTCASCRVLIKKGMENVSPPSTWEKFRLGVSMVSIGFENEMRLSCLTQVNGDIAVEMRPPLNMSGEKFW